MYCYRLVSWMLAAAGAFSCLAADPREYAVDVRVQPRTSPPVVVLSWPGDVFAREYKISRKLADEQSWSLIATLPGGSGSFADGNVVLGRAYEYEIEKTFFGAASSRAAHTYVYAGLNVSLVDRLGKVLLLVESSIAPSLAADLDLFHRDLVGAGWEVVRRQVSRHDSVPSVKALIKSEYSLDPANLRSVILFGNIPVPYSGSINPDMHPQHKGAWPADVYYGELDGSWTDHSVNITQASYPENHNVPGDGKFDQSIIPGQVKLEVGRIDLSRLPAFGRRTEVDLLRGYLRKNHEFRHRVFTLPRRGLILDGFGDLGGDAPAVDAWRHYPVFFGPNSIREVGPNGFFSTLQHEGYLWSYACGGGDYKSMDDFGGTADFATSSPRSAFLILHGSYFGDWDNQDNLLRGALGSSGYTLASIWSGLPHWFMHHMALGRTIGYSTKITQNNRGLYKSNQNFSAGEVHVALMGDPTLQMFPVAPPRNLNATASGGITLSWDPSLDDTILGYHVYHAQSAYGPYNRLTSFPGGATTFSHSPGAGTHHYMVRAIRLEQTGSGTFFSPSQGVFVQATTGGGPPLPIVSVTVEDGDASEAGPNPGSFRLSRNPVGNDSLVINFTLSGSALNGSDYAQTPAQVTIPGGSGSALVTITPIPDSLEEGDETVILSLAPGGAYQIGSPSSASLVIKDDYRPNQRPAISAIPSQTIPQDTATEWIAFTITDQETPAQQLSVRAESSNPALVPATAIALDGTGSERAIKLTPAAGLAGESEIIVTVSDGELESSSAFLLTVEPVNLPPIAHSQVIELPEDSPISILLTGMDPEGAPLGFILINQPANGTLTGTPPELTYTPAPEFYGTDEFMFAVTDGESVSERAAVQLTVLPVNDPPIISPLPAIEMAKNSTSAPMIIALSDVDTPAGELDLSARSLAPDLISDAGLLVEGGGLEWTLTITSSSQTGEAMIELFASDGTDSSSATLLVIVTNTPPEAFPDTFPIWGAELEISAHDLLRNDVDPDGDDLIIARVDLRSEQGAAITFANGLITYHAEAAPETADQFSYTIEDSSGAESTALVTLTPGTQPRFTSIMAGPEGITLRFQARAGQRVLIETTSDRQPWRNLGEVVTNARGSGVFVDTEAEGALRIYRIEQAPE